MYSELLSNEKRQRSSNHTRLVSTLSTASNDNPLSAGCTYRHDIDYMYVRVGLC